VKFVVKEDGGGKRERFVNPPAHPHEGEGGNMIDIWQMYQYYRSNK